ncbi:hypothetical protein VE02_05272 [Pseudogymnoascus sp. 03VT05]|nr:hypothetical protein VE02_05272 [Pseudogymnoascus sp. 03VT05]
MRKTLKDSYLLALVYAHSSSRLPALIEETARPSFFRLKDFKALEHLFLNSLGIYGHGRKHLLAEDQLLVWFLPASILSLHLQGQTGHLLSHLVKGLLGLAEAVSEGRFLRLKQVRCDAQNVLDDYAVCSMFAAVRVDFGGDTFPLSEEPMPLPEEDDADL